MKTEEFHYELKRANVADVPRIVDCALKFWGESKQSLTGDVDPQRFHEFLVDSLVNRPGCRIYFAEHDGMVIGYIAVYVQADYKDSLDGEMYQFYILPEYRGSGVARDLVGLAVQFWRDAGCKTMYAIASPEVGETNLSQFRNLFAKFGFEETGIIMTLREVDDGRRE